MKKATVAVIIINYNSADYTIECIQSIHQQVHASLSYQIVIIDNNSKNNDYEQVKKFIKNLQASHIQLVRSKLNLGFSGGNMLGVQYANADYLFFLNNDTVLLNDCLSILHQFMQANPQAGLCTGQMFGSDLQAHHSFSYLPTMSMRLVGSTFLRWLSPKKYPKRASDYTAPLEVGYVTGAALFVDYKKFAEIGGFDTTYFLYCEEEDIATQMHQHQYGVYVVPAAQFVHHTGKSTVYNFNMAREYYISRLYYHRKFDAKPLFFLHQLLYVLKNAKKFYKGVSYLKLAAFILLGASQKYSLKHQQKLRIEE